MPVMLVNIVTIFFHQQSLHKNNHNHSYHNNFIHLCEFTPIVAKPPGSHAGLTAAVTKYCVVCACVCVCLCLCACVFAKILKRRGLGA